MIGVWRALAVFVAVAFAAGCSDTSVSQVNAPTALRCQTALMRLPESFPASGSRLSATVTTTRECQWTVKSEAAWVQVVPNSGQGETALMITVAENPVATRRSSAIIVNDSRITVAQEAAPCRYDLSSSSARVSAAGGDVAVSVGAVAGCGWTAASEASWVRIVQGRGTGDGRAEFDVEVNSGGGRTASVSIAGLVFRIEQAAAPTTPTPPPPTPTPAPAPTPPAPTPTPPPAPTPTPPPAPSPPAPAPSNCSFSLDPDHRKIRAEGDRASVRVRTDERCEWTATTTASWIKLSTTRGTGDGEVRYSVDRNAGPARQGTIVIGGQTHRVEQAGAASSRVNFKGRISNLSGACPNLSFSADGRQVVTDSTTRFTEGSCADVRAGIEVDIEGELLADGVVRATKLEIKKN